MNSMAAEFSERVLRLVREKASEAAPPSDTVSLFREDDNGARFPIESGLKRIVAESRMEELFHHAHKQHYSIEAFSIAGPIVFR